VASLSKIIANGETLAEEEALQWASDHGIFCCQSSHFDAGRTSIGSLRSRAGGKMLRRSQPGRLVGRFLELHKVEVLNVVGSSKDDQENMGTFIRSIFETMILSTHV